MARVLGLARAGARLCRTAPGRWLRPLALGAASLAACSGDSPAAGGPEALFPEGYASSYAEVRDCRTSIEHELSRVRVLADPAALSPYLSREADFPPGAVVLKEEYDLGDSACAGEIIRWTVMERLAAGSSPETLDWRWQDVEPSRRVKSENEPRCAGCHTSCGLPPDGYQGTCAVAGATGGAFP